MSQTEKQIPENEFIAFLNRDIKKTPREKK